MWFSCHPLVDFNKAEAEGYMEDWAIIEVDSLKINTTNLYGNIISYICDYTNITSQMSKEWAILSTLDRNLAFSADKTLT